MDRYAEVRFLIIAGALYTLAVLAFVARMVW